MDALGLINLALMRIGERAIATLDADSTTARVASQFFHHSVDEVTSEHQWTFAKKRLELTEDTSADNLTEYAHAFAVPAGTINTLWKPDISTAMWRCRRSSISRRWLRRVIPTPGSRRIHLRAVFHRSFLRRPHAD